MKKPEPDSKEWWHDVAEGLGVTIHDLKQQLAEAAARVTALQEENDALRKKLGL